MRSMSGSAPIRPRRCTSISASARGSGSSAAVAVAAACGAIIGFLAFRFGVGGVYFAILTIAFAEFARIGFDHFTWVGGSGGLFLPVANYTQNDLWNLRGKPIMFYYVILALTVAAFVLCHALLRSRVGYYWQAIREDEAAARALGIDTFRYKMYRGADLRRHDFGRRRVLRVLLQQSVSRAGVQHRALDRDHPRPDHRRHRHAVRPDRRRLPAHRPCRDHVGVLACVRPGRARRARRCSTAWCLLASSSFCPTGVWPWLARLHRHWRSRDHDRAARPSMASASAFAACLPSTM